VDAGLAGIVGAVIVVAGGGLGALATVRAMARQTRSQVRAQAYAGYLAAADELSVAIAEWRAAIHRQPLAASDADRVEERSAFQVVERARRTFRRARRMIDVVGPGEMAFATRETAERFVQLENYYKFRRSLTVDGREGFNLEQVDEAVDRFAVKAAEFIEGKRAPRRRSRPSA